MRLVLTIYESPLTRPADKAALVLYVVLASEFILRYVYDHPFARHHALYISRRETDKKVKLMVLALIFETVCLFVR